ETLQRGPPARYARVVVRRTHRSEVVPVRVLLRSVRRVPPVRLAQLPTNVEVGEREEVRRVRVVTTLLKRREDPEHCRLLEVRLRSGPGVRLIDELTDTRLIPRDQLQRGRLPAVPRKPHKLHVRRVHEGRGDLPPLVLRREPDAVD